MRVAKKVLRDRSRHRAQTIESASAKKRSYIARHADEILNDFRRALEIARDFGVVT